MASFPNEGLLTVMLEGAVPLWVLEMQDLSWDERQKMANGCSEQLAQYGDQLMYGGPQAGATFNALAKGIAALSFAPGGVRFNGRHWESKEKDKRKPPPWSKYPDCEALEAIVSQATPSDR